MLCCYLITIFADITLLFLLSAFTLLAEADAAFKQLGLYRITQFTHMGVAHSAEQNELIYVSLMIIIGTPVHTRPRLCHSSSSDSALLRSGVFKGE